MAAGYSGTPLIRKLGIKPGFRIAVLDPPDDYWSLLGELPADVRIVDPPPPDGGLDFVHLFSSDAEDLGGRLASARSWIVPDGMIWISWPKRASGVATDLTGNVVREIGLGHRLVDTKVCAIDATWSGLKFVIRVEDRDG